MKPSRAHTHPELRGGGNGWLILVGAIVLAVVAGPVAHAISDLIEALAIIVAVILAIAGLAIVLTCWVRHRHTRPLTQRRVRALQAPAPPALGGTQEVHLHFHAVNAEDVAAIIARQAEARGQPGIHQTLREKE
jgi:undecaprenyl pyrophosphate phosphatase UppP